MATTMMMMMMTGLILMMTTMVIMMMALMIVMVVKAMVRGEAEEGSRGRHLGRSLVGSRHQQHYRCLDRLDRHHLHQYQSHIIVLVRGFLPLSSSPSAPSARTYTPDSWRTYHEPAFILD